jgi:hypothetical protein
VTILTEWIVPSAAARTASKPISAPGRQYDLTAGLSREVDEIRSGQQRAGAQDHNALSDVKHRQADLIEQCRRCAFEHEVLIFG